jgi:hypothetical protein
MQVEIETVCTRFPTLLVWTKLVRELGAGSGEKVSKDCHKKSKNRKISPKIEKFTDVNFKNSNFSKK